MNPINSVTNPLNKSQLCESKVETNNYYLAFPPNIITKRICNPKSYLVQPDDSKTAQHCQHQGVEDIG